MFYKSTTVFDDDVTHHALLSTKSTVSENLNGGQIQAVLNGFLYRSIQPTIESSHLFDDFVAYLLFYLIRIKKRRVTYVNKDIAISRLVLYLFTDDKNLKFRILRLLGIERCYLHRYLMYCHKVLTTVSDRYKDAVLQSTINPLSRESVKSHRLLAQESQDIGVNPSSIHSVCETMLLYMECYIEYRQKVISHYYKLCHKKARKQQRDKNSSGLDLNEIYQNYLLAVAKAIDKYDARRGAMTSYINWWILNVNTCDYSKYEYGIAYQIPSSYRRDIANHIVTDQTNFSVSLESQISTKSPSDSTTMLKDTIADENSDHALKYEENDAVRRFRRLVKVVDPTGIARISLGVEETFSEEELSKMKRHMAFLKKSFSSKKYL